MTGVKEISFLNNFAKEVHLIILSAYNPKSCFSLSEMY